MSLLELLTVKPGAFCVDKDLERELCVRIFCRLTQKLVWLKQVKFPEEVCSHIACTLNKYCKMDMNRVPCG